VKSGTLPKDQRASVIEISDEDNDDSVGESNKENSEDELSQ
jgi:hypothetical protein